MSEANKNMPIPTPDAASWQQLTLVVDAAQVNQLSGLLELFLAQAVTTENAGEDEFYEVAFPGTPNWQKVAVTGLFDEQIDLDPVVEFIRSNLSKNKDGSKTEGALPTALAPRLEVPVKIEKLVNQNWERVWLSAFKPIQVGHKLWVCPSWCEPPVPSDRNIILDPGLAFGTGSHATTGMCLEWLAEQQLDGKTVLDYGSGSGILAIAALLTGAKTADAVDVDPLANHACAENARKNGVADLLHAYLPKELPKQQYDLVIANILAEVIIELRDTLLVQLKTQGVLLLTGILDTQVERVVDAFKEILEDKSFYYEVRKRQQWRLLVCTIKTAKQA